MAESNAAGHGGGPPPVHESGPHRRFLTKLKSATLGGLLFGCDTGVIAGTVLLDARRSPGDLLRL